MRTNILLLLTLYLCIGCKSNVPKSETESTITSSANGLIFLDSIAASRAIVKDDVDGFFESISSLDMCIQMKSEKQYDDRQTALADYKQYLREDVSNWTTAEKKLMDGVFDSIQSQIIAINPVLYPKGIKLVKIKTNHYGPDVYYTRGMCIMIPENIFASPNAAVMVHSVMIHEIFHILSRYEPKLRDQIYELIGFKPHNKQLQFSDEMKERWLTNPDGVSKDYFIELSNGKQKVAALPLIMSNKPKFVKSSPSFFSYLQFDLFDIKDDGTVEHSPAMATTLADEQMPSFFDQIKDNTQYIIHPDEISADNFIYAITEANVGHNKHYSVEGAKLVKDIQVILKNYKK